MIYKRQGRWVPAWEMVGENEGFADLSLNAEESEKLDAFLSRYESVKARRMAWNQQTMRATDSPSVARRSA
jgi:hypothetical protein